MSVWEKKNIFECENSIVYLDNTGFGYLSTLKPENIVFIANGKKYNSSDLYRKIENDKYKSLSFYLRDLLSFLYKETIYLNVSYINNTYEPIAIESVSVQLDMPIFSNPKELDKDPNSWQKQLFRLNITNRSELERLVVYASNEKARDCIKYCMLGLKEGQKYHSLSYGICSVEKTYDDLYENKPICRIKLRNGTELELMYGDNSLIMLPQNFDNPNINDVFGFLTKSFNSKSLMPVVEKHEKTGNSLFVWRPIVGAISYSLEFYREITLNNKKELYYLCNVKCDFPYYCLTKEDLDKFGSPLYVRIVALNKKNWLIAFSKGLRF